MEIVREKLKATNRRHPCPICEGVNGNCRTTGDLVLCMERREAPSGWIFIRETKDRLWGMFAPAGTGEQRSFKPKVVEREPEKKLIPDDRKHEAFQLLTYQIDLDDRHVADFRRRGLSDSEIAYLSGFARSVSNGYIIPFQNVHGQFTV